MPGLLLLRHARVLLPAGTCYGATDAPADAAHTTASAAALAGHWQAQGWAPPPKLWCSPLRRCQQLAQALCQRHWPHTVCQPDARLREMGFGAWEGRPWADIARNELQAWTNDFAAYRAGWQAGGATRTAPPMPPGESVAQLLQRVAAARADAHAVARADPRGAQAAISAATNAAPHAAPHAAAPLLWIAHAGVVSALRWLQQAAPGQMPRADAWPRPGVAPGEWTLLPLDV